MSQVETLSTFVEFKKWYKQSKNKSTKHDCEYLVIILSAKPKNFIKIIKRNIFEFFLFYI